jgi:hypothetical protein
MTRAQQNDFIITKIVSQLGDMDNVQKRVEKSFNIWFRDLAKQGMELITPAPAAGGGGSGEEGGAEAAPEGGA